MQAQATRVPAPLPSDPIDVSEALEIAKALWEKGDPGEALRWIRRAVEAADEAGDFQRMVALARGAADLEESLAGAPATSEPPPAPTSKPATPPQSIPSPVPTRPSAAPSRPSAAPQAARATDHPPSSVRLHKTKPPPLPPAATRASQPPPRAQAPLRSSAAPEPHPGTEIRVSIKTSVRDPSLLVVRRLADGQAAPAGAHEARLVLPEGVSLELGETPYLNGKASR